jgi:GTP1/Obg family GTP-binding protein
MAEDENELGMTFAPQTTEDLKKFLEDAERLKENLKAEEPKDRFDAYRFTVSNLKSANGQLTLLLRSMVDHPEVDSALEFLKELHRISVQIRSTVIDINSAIVRDNLLQGVYPHRRKNPAGIA